MQSMPCPRELIAASRTKENRTINYSHFSGCRKFQALRHGFMREMVILKQSVAIAQSAPRGYFVGN
jgi:hypothetical protein